VADAISNTSPLLYLHRVGILDWLPQLFDSIWVPEAVVRELEAGRNGGYDVPVALDHPWLSIVNPKITPVHWLALDLGPGELGAMALALEHPSRVVLLDDLLARRTAAAAGLQVWGTLRVLLEGKGRGLVADVAPLIDSLAAAGLWISADVRQRILKLAGE
jgi:predicted nucleic acid-binding protein